MKKWIEENFINKYNSNYFRNSYFIKIYGKDVYNKIVNSTNFLSEDCKLSERIYCILNYIKEIPRCPICGKVVKFNTFNKGYKEHCSNTCKNSNLTIKKKIRQTNLEKYGVEYVSQNKQIKEKIKNTNLIKYGAETPLLNQEIKEKIKQTNLEKFGVEKHFQLQYIKEQIKITNLEKYGTKFPTQLQEIKEKIKQTNIKKYGVEYGTQLEDIKNKIKKTNLERYGTEYPTQNKLIKEKIEQTNLIKYNVNSPIQNKEIKDKIRKSNLERYGTEYPLQNESIKRKFQETSEKIYGYKNPFQNEEIKNKIKQKNFEKHRTEYSSQRNYTLEQLEIVNNSERLKEIYNEHVDNEIPVEQLSLKYRSSSTLLGKYFYKNGFKIKRFSKSYQEKLIKLFLDELNIDYIQNDRKILNGKELDFYIPEYQLGIEVNGIYWHSEEVNKDKYNLLTKLNLCKERGINLLHFWNIEVEDKFEIVKSIIKDNLGLNQEININGCIIQEISQEESYEFYENNHILGWISCDYNYGLYYEEELLSCIGINKIEKGYEIIRDCTKIEYTLNNNLLFDKLIELLCSEEIYLILDKRLFNNLKYIKYGFILEKETFPNLLYYNNKIIYQDIKDLKHKKIYDCGNLILKYYKRGINDKI